ncbi:MAG: hypothetical protein RLZZ294_939, partial [Bacteroidota bacterium]
MTKMINSEFKFCDISHIQNIR